MMLGGRVWRVPCPWRFGAAASGMLPVRTAPRCYRSLVTLHGCSQPNGAGSLVTAFRSIRAKGADTPTSQTSANSAINPSSLPIGPFVEMLQPAGDSAAANEDRRSVLARLIDGGTRALTMRMDPPKPEKAAAAGERLDGDTDTETSPDSTSSQSSAPAECVVSEIWEGSPYTTFTEAWSSLWQKLAEASASEDVEMVTAIQQYDLPRLARCSSRAEVFTLLSLLPEDLRNEFVESEAFDVDEVEEWFMHVGQPIEVRGKTEVENGGGKGGATAVEDNSETMLSDELPKEDEGTGSRNGKTDPMDLDALLDNLTKEQHRKRHHGATGHRRHHHDREESGKERIREDPADANDGYVMPPPLPKPPKRYRETVTILRPPTQLEIDHMVRQLGKFSSDGRACMRGTLHRISCFRCGKHEGGKIVGLTVRVGRYVPNAASALAQAFLRKSGSSMLILSRPGSGKTTVLRDLATTLARGGIVSQTMGGGSTSPVVEMPRVLIVDTSGEIGGEGIVPLPYLGRARRIQVHDRKFQHEVLLQAVQNHTPDVIVIDEISTEEEALAAMTISMRGVRIIATAHGDSLKTLTQNKALNVLVGGSSQALLSFEERKLRNKAKKSILERPYPSSFGIVVELLPERGKANITEEVDTAVDCLLDERPMMRNGKPLMHPITLQLPPRSA